MYKLCKVFAMFLGKRAIILMWAFATWKKHPQIQKFKTKITYLAHDPEVGILGYLVLSVSARLAHVAGSKAT